MMIAGTESGFCAQTANVWQLVGTGIMLLKILIPIVLIVNGIIILGKAVISDDEKDMKNGWKMIIKKFVVAAVIFFLPTIISAMFGIVNGFNDLRDDYNVCRKCITSPNGDFCKNKVLAMNE